MVVYKHTIFFRKIKSYFENSQLFAHSNYIVLFVVFFGLILLFGTRISNTINQGFRTQSKVDKITKEVEELEKKKKDLEYRYELSKSETTLEAQIRGNNKKKDGEEIYVVSLPEDVKPIISEESSNQSVVTEEEKVKLANWEKWVSRIFR